MESSSESEWEDVEEDDDTTVVTCLFCLEATSCPEALFKHCCAKHEIDIVKMIKDNGIGFIYDTHAQLVLLYSCVENS